MFRFQTQTSRDASGVGIRGGLRRSPLRVKSGSRGFKMPLPLYPPESGLKTDIAACLFRANFGSDPISFDHLIGPSTDRSGRFSQSAALPPS